MTHSPSSAQSDLKPCPFCGGPVSLENPIGRTKWWGVVCRNTENRGGTCAIEQRPSASKDAAIERWNRRADASAHTLGEDAANVAIGEREAYLARFGTENESLAFAMRAIAADAYDTGYATARAALTAEKVASDEPPDGDKEHWRRLYMQERECRQQWQQQALDVAPAPSQTAQPVAQTLALTDEQREAIEYAVRWMDENVSNRYAHTATKELRALLAAQPASSLAEGDKQ